MRNNVEGHKIFQEALPCSNVEKVAIMEMCKHTSWYVKDLEGNVRRRLTRGLMVGQLEAENKVS